MSKPADQPEDRPKRDFSLREKLAAALAIIAEIPFEHRKQMHADQVIGLFQFDHDPVPYIHDGQPVHWNCVPRYIGEHREKTKDDVKMIYKVRRLSQANIEFQQRMLAKAGQTQSDTVPPKSPKAKRKMQSRGFSGHRKFNGDPVWKDKP